MEPMTLKDIALELLEKWREVAVVAGLRAGHIEAEVRRYRDWIAEFDFPTPHEVGGESG